MFLDPLFLMLLLLITALGFIIFLFLPSLIEIVKPRDKGPRRMLRTPLQRIMRKGAKSVFVPKSDSVANSSTSKNFQSFLKETGVKTRRIGNDTLRILSDVEFPPNLEISDNIVIDGALTMGDRCVFHGSVKARGNVTIGNYVVIKGNLVSNGNVDIQDEAVIGGSVHSEGSVRLGEKVFIGLAVVADGDVELHENSEVKENILTHGIIKVLRHPKLDFPSTLEDIG